ncbi:FAD-dependent oxidoreductase [Clostridium sp. AM58-1XD]|uniref:FAD-dependent oxidoreductase n=1 Tax=Clostridium sp. AM58-1XD TaxID=2292307 RepID=UPI00268EB452
MLSEKLTIYEKTKVLKVKKHVVYTNRGTITADHIIFTSHYPFINIPGFYFARQHQERSYVLGIFGTKKLPGMYYSIDQGGFSFRWIGQMLLLGGGSHRTGKSRTGSEYEMLAKAADKYYPGCEIRTRWSAQDCIPHDSLPFIGKYSNFRPYWYIATGFKKWGMTSSMLSAMIIKDQICGKKNPYESLFRPQRWFFRASIKAMLVDIGESIKGLAKGSFHLPFKAEQLPAGHGGIVRIGFRRYACYKDKSGTLHKISARCPHLGCELEWNPAENSWDCPCHGSRFDYDGNLIDNPAQTRTAFVK